MADRVRINGIAHSWGSVKLKIAGQRYLGVTSINYGDKLETAFGYGMGAAHAARSQSRGKYVTDEIVMKVEAATAQLIRNVLASKGNGTGYGQAQVPIVLQYLEPGDNPITVEFERCRVVGDTTSDEEGSDVLTTELKWTTFGIKRNGKTLYEARR
ncbi:MAG: hypothetical protein GY700_13515 [Propionibacteriaceae bacterium]|nr:hypothetical protein [Propionibacteriaceae bacterium]